MQLTRLHVEGYHRLSNGDGLGRLLGGVLGEPLLLECLGLLINLVVVGSKEVNLVVVLLDGGGGSNGGRGRGSVLGVGPGRVSRESRVGGRVGLDVGVPTGRVGVGGSVGGRGEGLEDGDVGLRGCVSAREDPSALVLESTRFLVSPPPRVCSSQINVQVNSWGARGLKSHH